ncbi:MAG: hypothetical protein KBS91_02070, partial [Firmicutes bacterium]|nr:hypothetical protein [Candidatus Caballimonas caccae]
KSYVIIKTRQGGKMKTELTIEKKKFTIDNEEIEYLSCTAVIDGNVVRFVPKKDDKSLLQALTKNLQVVKEK